MLMELTDKTRTPMHHTEMVDEGSLQQMHFNVFYGDTIFQESLFGLCNSFALIAFLVFCGH